MGSSARAKAHVESLFDFAARTPFESGPVIEASRMMRTFGGDILDTKKNLQLFGDAAAGTSAPIQEVGFWMSRAYADIQAGRPFGEAAMRLSELGIVTPQVRNKLEDLQKSGASSNVVWNTLTGSLDRFAGSMKRQEGTWTGLTSTAIDNVNLMVASAFKPLFEAGKELLKGFNAWLGTEGAQRAIRGFAASLKGALATAGDVFRALGDALGTIGPLLGPIAGGIAMIAAKGVILKAVGLVDNFKDMIRVLPGVSSGLTGAGRAAAAANAAFGLWGIAIMLLVTNFDQVMQGLRVLQYHILGLQYNIIDLITKIPLIGEAFVDLRDSLAVSRAGIVADMAETQHAMDLKAGAVLPRLTDFDRLTILAEAVFAVIPDSAQAAADKAALELLKIPLVVGVVLRDIIDKTKKFKTDLVAAWTDALRERNVAANAADQIIVNNAEITAQRKILADKKSTAAERAEARIRLRGLQDDNAVLLVEQASYGTWMEQITRTKALLTSAALLSGLQSRDPDIRNYWLQVQTTANDRLTDLATSTQTGGANIVRNLDRGLRDPKGFALVTAASNMVAVRLRDGMYGGPVGDATGWGSSVTTAFANGLTSKIAMTAVTRNLAYIGVSVGKYLKGLSPPKEGPLSTIDTWGTGIGTAWAGGLLRGASAGIARLSLPSVSVGAATPAERLGGQVGYLGGGSGSPVTINQYFGPGSVRSREDIRDIGREMAERGRLLGANFARA
jgi:hypothetical protein